MVELKIKKIKRETRQNTRKVQRYTDKRVIKNRQKYKEERYKQKTK